MSRLTRFGGPALPVGPLVERAISAATADPRPGFVSPLEAVDLAAARGEMARLDAECAATARNNAALVEDWLFEATRGLCFPVDEEAAANMLVAILRASGDLPVSAFGPAALEIACRTIDRMSSKAVDAVVRPIGRAMQVRRQALRLVVEASDAAARASAAVVAAPSADERAAIVAAFRAELVAARDPAPAPSVRASHLTPDQQLIVLDRIILSGEPVFAEIARFRAAALRARLAGGGPEKIPTNTRDGRETRE